MLRCGGRRRAILSAFARFPWLQTQLLENVRLMRVLSQHYGKYRASGRALRDKIISLSSQCRRSSFLKQPMEEAGPSLPSTTSARSSQPRADEEAPMEPMQVCFSHQTAFQVLRAIDARELAGSGDTAWRLPARAPSARELEEVVKRIENDRPGLSIVPSIFSWERLQDAAPLRVACRTCAHGRCVGSPCSGCRTVLAYAVRRLPAFRRLRQRKTRSICLNLLTSFAEPIALGERRPLLRIRCLL